MYRHYESSDDVFVDREEYIEWMDEALERCKKKSVVLHLKGIGGIGKSSLLKHWIKTKEKTVRVDCEQYTTFYDRLNFIAKGAVLHGVNLQRFDVLWQIRQRFVEGVEPVKEEGREWAKDIVMAIPFIGSLATIGTAIRAVGSKVTPKLKGKYSTVGKWLQERLGKNHIERLLEILWKEPRHAEFLYLDALLEDINNRSDETPILFLFDHFERVDSEASHWRYQGNKINEGELWSIFLCSLKNCVGVMAGRKPPVKRKDLELEENELTELDCDSCVEMLDLQGVTNKELQQKIISVTGGNPFVIDAICDMKDAGTIALDDIENLRADTLEEVRLKTWRRLFNMVGNLQDTINRAGLLQFFDRNLMNIIAPSMTTDVWDRLLRLSFVSKRDDGTWVLHDLAQELILAELGPRVKSLTDEVAQLLEKRAEDDGDVSLIGHSLSVTAAASEEEAIAKAKNVISGLNRRDLSKDALKILSCLSFKSVRGNAEHQGMLGWALEGEARYAEGEAALRNAIEVFEELSKDDFLHDGPSLGFYLTRLGHILTWCKRPQEGVEYCERAVDIQRQLVEKNPEMHSENLAESIALLGFELANSFGQIEEASALAQEAVDIFSKFDRYKRLGWALNILALTKLHPGVTPVYQRALEVQREFSSNDPENLYLKAIHASICHNLARSLYAEGRIPEAEEIHNECIAIRRELSDINPDAYEWRFAMALSNYGEFLWRTRQLSKAEKWMEECLQLFQKLAKKYPDVWNPWLAEELLEKAVLLTNLGRIQEADSINSRAIGLLREHVNLTDDSYTARRTLANYMSSFSSGIHVKSFKIIDAQKSLNEAIQFGRENRDHSIFDEYWLGLALNNFGTLYLLTGKIPEAKTTLEEATAILEKHKELGMVITQNNYAISLQNLALVCKREGRLKESGELFKESLSIYEDIIQKIPIKFHYDMSVTLNNYSILLREMGNLQDATLRLSEAIEVQKQFAKIELQYFKPILANSLNNLGILYSETDRSSDAEEALREAIEIRRRLFKLSPEIFQIGLASSLHNYGVLLRKTDRSLEAQQSLKEAWKFWDQLVTNVPEVINPYLAKTLYHLRILLLEDGTKDDEVKQIEKHIKNMDFEFSEEDDFWIEEEEPQHIW